MSGIVGRIRALQNQIGSGAQPYVLLVLRIFFGYTIFRSGWGKLTDLDFFTGYFSELGIPMPGVNAVVVGFLEAAGGLLIMAGLATRVMSAVLTVTLLVAVITAHRAEVAELFSTPIKFILAAPVPFIAMFLVFVTTGAGRFSVDHVLSKGDAES